MAGETQLIKSLFGEGGRTNLILGAVAAAGTALAPAIKDPNTRRIVQFGSIGLGLYVILRVVYGSGSGLKSAISESAALPSGKGSLFEQALGTIGRATGNEPPPGISTRADRPATEGPHLGTPKNLLGIAGVIRSPVTGDNVTLPLFADTIPLSAAIENQSGSERSGTIKIRQLTNEVPSFVDGPRVTLAPGEFRELLIRIPAKRSYIGAGYSGNMDVALLYETHALDRVTFNLF